MDVRLSPALALLLACLAWPLDQQALAKVADAASAMDDWDEFTALVSRHRANAKVCHALQNASVNPPGSHSSTFRQVGAASVIAEMEYAAESARLFETFSAAGLRPLILKGVSSALLCYGRLGLKFSCDIDILVEEEHVPRALALLQERGYRFAENTDPLNPEWRRRFKDVLMLPSGVGAMVELHWRLFDNHTLLPRPFAQPPHRLSISGIDIETLNLDVVFAYLCLHGAQHAWSRLKWLAEVNAFLSRADEAETERLFQFASAHRAGPAAAQALALCALLFGRAMPRSVARVASGWRIRLLVAIALRAATRGGATEMEALPMGSTLKNISHYLLAGGVSYWRAELAYDIGDTSAVGRDGRTDYGAFGRIGLWLWRSSRQIPHREKDRR